MRILGARNHLVGVSYEQCVETTPRTSEGFKYDGDQYLQSIRTKMEYEMGREITTLIKEVTAYIR